MNTYSNRPERIRKEGISSQDKRGLRGIPAEPFGCAACYYHSLGWAAIPATRSKVPLMTGVSGHHEADLSGANLDDAVRQFRRANIGLRLWHNIIGIDVDAYDARGGGRTLADLERRLGPLPVTWRSTSRAPEDGVSGIYLFHAPREESWVWVGDLGPGSGIEIVQRHHRFVTAAPSVHPAGRVYSWWRGIECVNPPRPGDLPLLPVSWRQFLLSSRRYTGPGEAASAEETVRWYARVSGGATCRGMRAAARREADRVRAAASRGGLHDALIRAVTHLCLLAAEGCTGLDEALAEVEAEVTGRRSRNLRAEWTGAVNSAMARAAAGPQEEADVCDVLLKISAAEWRRLS